MRNNNSERRGIIQSKPSIILFIIGILVLFAGIGLWYFGNAAGDYLIGTGIAAMGIFWIWSIILVLTAPDLKPFQKRFWMIAVIAVPVLGGLLFHVMHGKPGRITT